MADLNRKTCSEWVDYRKLIHMPGITETYAQKATVQAFVCACVVWGLKSAGVFDVILDWQNLEGRPASIVKRLLADICTHFPNPRWRLGPRLRADFTAICGPGFSCTIRRLCFARHDSRIIQNGAGNLHIVRCFIIVYISGNFSKFQNSKFSSFFRDRGRNMTGEL